MSGVAGDFQLPLALAGTVDAQRRTSIRLAPGLLATAVKHVVGRVMRQPYAKAQRFFSQHRRAQRVDGIGLFGIGLRFIHRGVSRRVDDQVRGDLTQGLA